MKEENINYFYEVNETSRFYNALLNEIRKTNQLLEQLILSIQPKQENQVDEIIQKDSELENKLVNRKKVK